MAEPISLGAVAAVAAEEVGRRALKKQMNYEKFYPIEDYKGNLNEGVEKGVWKGPFFVLYRSNAPFSSGLGFTSGL